MTGRGRRARRRARARSPPTSSSSPAARRTPPSCCSPRRATSIPTGSPTAPTRSGRNYMFHNSQAVLALSREENPTIFQKTLGLNDFYFADDEFEYPLGQHPDGRQVAGADVPRREAGRDEARARAGRWSGSPSTRSTSGSRPRTCRGRRTASPSTGDGRLTLAYTATNDVPKQKLYDKLKSMLGQARHGPGPSAAALRVHEERDPGRRGRAPGRHVPLRQRSGDVGARTSTAEPTSSTTSTSSTRASSRASARSTRR